MWYKDGLKFACRQCGRCCVGEPGYVWVNEDEITAMAKQLGLSRSRFEASFVRMVGGKKSLIELSNGDCIFYDPEIRGCKYYRVRPNQCQTWPFWEQNIDGPNSWKKTAKFCPGCDQGPLYAEEQITALKIQSEL
ncbi:MAG: YkgJ family cysteine cluster protein [Planctomycetaceae bacterium]|nr:YkgJ family cysteine cluster protein [Planctomycetaceae bacterium]